MLGSFAVGKTSLVARYVDSIFSDTYRSTVGVKISKKQVDLGDNVLNMVLWDLHGDDEYQQVRTSYLEGQSGYLLVVDGTRPETLDTALALKQRVDTEIGKSPFCLLLNKSDLQEQWTLDETVLSDASHGDWDILKTSAKTSAGVEEAFLTLAQKMCPDVE